MPGYWIVSMLFASLLLCPVITNADDDEVGLIFKRAKIAYSKINDYTCSFSKKEAVNGYFVDERNIELKFMKGPRIYMKWTEGELLGMEAIYAGEETDKKLVVHGTGGLLSPLTLRIEPAGSAALSKSRHPITEVGIGFLINEVERNYQMAKQNKQGSVTCMGRTSINAHAAIYVKARLPEGSGYYGPDIDIYFDETSHLPILLRMRDLAGNMLEEYSYENMRINTGLKKTDFDPNNPTYGF